MSNSGARGRRRSAPFAAVLCLSLFSTGSCAAESYSQQPTSPANQSIAEKVADLQRDVTLLKNDLGLQSTPAKELTAQKMEELQQDVKQLKKEVENRSKPAVVLALPWIALGSVGLIFVTGWLVLRWREQSLVRDMKPDQKTLTGLTEVLKKLDGQASQLSESIGELNTNVTAATRNINELWKALAIDHMTKGPNS